MRRSLALLPALTALTSPCAALAHGAGSTVGYNLTLESMLESVTSPVVALLILGLGILAGTSGAARSKLALAACAAGLLAGIFAAPVLGSYGAIGGLVIGAACSLLAATALRLPGAALVALAALAGFAASVYNLGSARYPAAREMIARGMAVVLATDFNPGSSPAQDLSLVGLLARIKISNASSLRS